MIGTEPSDEIVRIQSDVFSRSRSDLPVADLMRDICSVENFRAAWNRVRSNKGAASRGIDGRSCHDFPNGGLWLKELRAAVRDGKFQGALPRVVSVPKAGTASAACSGSGSSAEYRDLAMLNVADRIVHTAVKQVLEPVFDPLFLSGSFGFRPGRSVVHAIRAALIALNTKLYSVAVRVDVRNCFDSIPHWLIEQTLRQRVSDSAVLKLTRRLMLSGRKRSLFRSMTGIPQGSSLSPLLCNVALHNLDSWMEGHECFWGTAWFRYADDLMLLVSDQAAAQAVIAVVEERMKDLQLAINTDKLGIHRVNEGVLWLGQILKPESAISHRYASFIPPDKIVRFRNEINEIASRPRTTVAQQLELLNRKLFQWREAYKYTLNCESVFAKLDDHVAKRFADHGRQRLIRLREGACPGRKMKRPQKPIWQKT